MAPEVFSKLNFYLKYNEKADVFSTSATFYTVCTLEHLDMKLWKEGVRIFKGLGKFKVYHFGSISLRKKNDLKVNKGSNTFLKKWGFTPAFFDSFATRTLPK